MTLMATVQVDLDFSGGRRRKKRQVTPATLSTLCQTVSNNTVLHQCGMWNGSGDLTCLEDCPDVCIQNRGKWVLFWPKVKDWRDPLHMQAPLYGYTFAVYQHRDVMTVDISIYFALILID